MKDESRLGGETGLSRYGPRPSNDHALPAALGCRGWFTAKVTPLGESTNN